MIKTFKIVNKKELTEDILAELFGQLSAIERVNDTIYILTNKADKKGIYSVKRAQIVLEIEFDRISELIGNYLLVGKDGKFGIFSARVPALVLPIEYDPIAYAGPDLYTVVKDGKKGTFKIGTNLLVME